LGKIDSDDMMLGARSARLLYAVPEVSEVSKVSVPGNNDCLFLVASEPHGEPFDIDLRLKAEVKATRAKLLRFFEAAANEKANLSKMFKEFVSPIDQSLEGVKLAQVVKDLGNEQFEVCAISHILETQF
jgi:hypothetical protein